MAPPDTDTRPPLTDEQKDIVRANVKLIAAKFGMKHPLGIYFRESPDINAQYTAGSRGDELLIINTAAVTDLTSRELNAFIAHEMAHRKSFWDNSMRKMTKREGEAFADATSVKVWGDPEALISAIQKNHDKKFTDREYVEYAHQFGNKTNLRKYDKASDEEKKALTRKAHVFMYPLSSEPHPAPTDREFIEMANEWGNRTSAEKYDKAPEAEKSELLRKAHFYMYPRTYSEPNPPFTDREFVEIANISGNKTNLREYDKASDEDKSKLVTGARDYMKKREHDNQYPPLQERIDAIRAAAVQQKDHVGLSPQMQKALADFKINQNQAEGNYLPMNKTVPEGKFIG